VQKKVPQISNRDLSYSQAQCLPPKTDDRFRKQKGSVEEWLESAAHRRRNYNGATSRMLRSSARGT